MKHLLTCFLLFLFLVSYGQHPTKSEIARDQKIKNLIQMMKTEKDSTKRAIIITDLAKELAVRDSSEAAQEAIKNDMSKIFRK